jgi:two-component system sensor histidine kinase BarA
MKPWSLQTRLIALVLIPTFILIFGLGISVVLTRMHDIEAVQNERGHILLAKYRFAFDEISDVTPNNLRALALDALEEPSLRSLTLLSADGKTLLHSGPLPSALNSGQTLTLDATIHRYFTRSSWLYVQALGSAIPAENGRLQRAWVMLEFSTSEMTLHKYKALLLVLLLCLGTLALMTMLLVRLLQRWLSPVADMTITLQEIDGSRLDDRLSTNASGDLYDLENEINALLGRLAADTEELKSSMEQANADLHETMEAMEIQNIELTLARKEAVEGNRIKSEFLANISHEIRTPLNGIMGFTKLLLKTQLSPRQLDYVRTVQKSADSLLAIINDVLDLSKIEAGKLVLDHIPLDIEEVIFDVLGMLAPAAEEKNLEQVAFIYDDVPRHLMGDPLRLKQIITNLVNNAIKFTPSGEVTIRCMLENQTERHASLRISVSDTGIGLSESMRADLFRAFSQGDPSTTRKFGGTGLGLVISKHLVEQMQGEINFESNDGAGTTFWFTLRAEMDNHTHSGFYGDHLHQRHILVAEPHPATRQFLANTLDHWGARSATVSSFKALEAAIRGRAVSDPLIDALIMDLSLLGSRNVTDNAQLDKLRQLINCPIILLSRSSDFSQEKGQYRDAQIVVLRKPVAPRELYARLLKIFSHLPLQPAQLVLNPPRKLQNLRVLAVDDNPANLKLVSTILTDLSVDTISAADGHAAVRLCQEQVFDLVFMDIQMPGMSGLEATCAIRAHESETHSKKHLPIVALTAHAMANEREALLKSGMDDYLTKPVQESQLAHMLAKWTGIDPRDQLHDHQREGTTLSNTSFSTSYTQDRRDPDASVIVDWQEGVRLAAGKQDLARDMLIMLFNSLEQEKRKIEAAFADNNLEGLLGHVHYLHGATRYCGVPALRDAAQILETDIKTLLHLHHQQQEEGSHHAPPDTEFCDESVQILLGCITQLIEWRENNALPA